MRSWLLVAVSACSSAPPAVLVLSPAQAVTFGSVNTGKTIDAQISVANSGQTAATQVADTSAALGQFAYTGGAYPGTGGDCGSTIAIGASCKLSVTFAPTTATSQTATLTLSYFDGGTPQTTTEQLTGTGTAPVVITTSDFDPSQYQPSDAAIGQTVDALGTVTTSVTGSSPVKIATKNADDDAIIIIALSNAAENYLLIDKVLNPDGVTISSGSFFDSHGDYTIAEKNRAYPSQGAQAMVIPQSPDFSTFTGAGDYHFVLTAIDGSGAAVQGVTADLYVVHHPAVATEPRVSVNMFFSGSAGLTAATATSDSSSPIDNPFREILNAFVLAWGELAPSEGAACAGAAASNSLGLCIDHLNFYDLPSGYGDVSGDFTQDTPGEHDLVEVFEQSAGHPAGVNFFFLNSITLDGASSSSGSQRLLGVDGNIPSPGAFMGTPRSGAAIVLDTLPTGAAEQQRVGATIAHEGGHYLGLYHVQEADCSADNLIDTTCDTNCTSFASDNHRASTAACTDSTTETNENMMYWAASADFAQENFTSEQAQTVRRHTLVH